MHVSISLCPYGRSCLEWDMPWLLFSKVCLGTTFKADVPRRAIGKMKNQSNCHGVLRGLSVAFFLASSSWDTGQTWKHCPLVVNVHQLYFQCLKKPFGGQGRRDRDLAVSRICHLNTTELTPDSEQFLLVIIASERAMKL